MALFTIILEFDGGTYIEQVIANSIDDAQYCWKKQFLHLNVLGEMTERFLDSFSNDYKEFGLTKIEGMSGLWTFSFKFNRKSARGHFINSAS
ncbi:MAG TPA: hypothetical protein VK533_14335 [Sphingomonas sp.]|uniref:hypothetical protein n=1 Tax=Sphingomonas sp. TaxID=28214 RepID=UPI002C2613A8|nr:hypothetical protein [Sphingomonas sp.]HMI20711.1 hypothetical protein [Sphingomonas sp.]